MTTLGAWTGRRDDAAPAPVPLLPGAPQRLWGWPAVVNFSLGGTGAGLYAMAAVAGSGTALRTAAWLGPLLVLAGFAAVATEAGRPLRGARVLRRVRSSWMSRELWLGGIFAGASLATLPLPGAAPRLAAAGAALALAFAQGQILRHARGVAAWSVPPVPAVFVTSALASGAGLLALLEAARGAAPAPLLGAALAALVLHAGAWAVFLAWSADPAFVEGVRPLRDAAGLVVGVGGGLLLPALLAALAIAAPPLGPALAAAAGVLALAGQAGAKAALVLRAGQLRPITLPAERLQGGLS
jgi:hypothetical protein